MKIRCKSGKAKSQKLASRLDGSTNFKVLGGCQNPTKFEENSMKKVGSFPDHSWDGFFMDFGAILAPSWEPKWNKNRYKRGLEK